FRWILLVLRMFTLCCSHKIHIQDLVDHDGFQYYFSLYTETWYSAKDFCRKFDGFLASIHKKEESIFITQELIKRKIGTAFIGGTDEPHEGKWVWLDGTPWSFEAWAGIEPNNNKGAEHCLAVTNRHEIYNWDDILCNQNGYFICKFKDFKGDGYIMESQLHQRLSYPIQMNGWNKTFGKIPLVECYDKCFEDRCKMLYHTTLKKCTIFEKKFLDNELLESPYKENDPEEIVFIYWLKP
uniref:C-type lectin domain-containing protein n=1 Tax=Clytia hemisphaerica TaxID=252671 RepID=A0A7M5X925_9CNID